MSHERVPHERARGVARPRALLNSRLSSSKCVMILSGSAVMKLKHVGRTNPRAWMSNKVQWYTCECTHAHTHIHTREKAMSSAA